MATAPIPAQTGEDGPPLLRVAEEESERPAHRHGELRLLSVVGVNVEVVPPEPARGTRTLQPIPKRAGVNYYAKNGVVVTAITRVWNLGDEKWCRLCPLGTCCAIGNVCTIQVGRMVPIEDVAMFSTADLPGFVWQDGATGLRLSGDGSLGRSGSVGGVC